MEQSGCGAIARKRGSASVAEAVITEDCGAKKTEAEVWTEWVENMPRGAPGFPMGLANISELETFDNYLNAADQYLYLAKHSGRNRVFSDYQVSKIQAS